MSKQSSLMHRLQERWQISDYDKDMIELVNHTKVFFMNTNQSLREHMANWWFHHVEEYPIKLPLFQQILDSITSAWDRDEVDTLYLMLAKSRQRCVNKCAWLRDESHSFPFLMEFERYLIRLLVHW